MKNTNIRILSQLIICLLLSVSAQATATQKKCDDGWKNSPAYKSNSCTGVQVGEDPSDRRTCLLQSATCNGKLNTPLSIQPHELSNLNVCSGYLRIGTCSSSSPTQQECQQSWEQSSAYKSNSCAGTIQIDSSNNVCVLTMTCDGTNNGSLTYTVSEVSGLNVCSGLLKTGVCKSK